MKLPLASLLATVLLLLVCLHARAVTVAWIHVSGGNVMLTAKWSRQRIPAFNPDTAADGFGRVSKAPETSFDAWLPRRANGSPVAERRGSVNAVADINSLDAVLLQTEPRGNTGSSPPGPGVAGKSIVFLSDCDTLLDEMNQRQSVTQLEQPKWLNLSGILSGSNSISPLTTVPAASDSRPSCLNLIL